MRWNWLHLSDLHCGSPRHDWYWPQVEDDFFADLAKLHDVAGPWEFVFFTGDLVQSGRPEEFEVLDRVLRRLWARLRGLGSAPWLLAVPGNHDLERPLAADATARVLREWSDGLDVPDRFWQEPDCPERRAVDAAFGGYRTWWKATPLRPPGVRPGLLPGDFAYTSDKTGIRLGIVGLNSSALQLAGGLYEGKLALHVAQFHAVAGDAGGPAWARDHHVRLLLTHQPPSWLSPQSQTHLHGEVAVPGRFAAHLFGHLHAPLLTTVAHGGAETRTHWQATSLFGLDTITTETGELSRRHGYAAGRLEVQRDGAVLLSFWPREARRTQAGHLHLGPDTSYVLDAQGQTSPLLVPAGHAPDGAPAGGHAASAGSEFVFEGTTMRDATIAQDPHGTKAWFTNVSMRDFKSTP